MITKRKNDTTIALLTKLIFEYLVSKLEQNVSQYMSCQIFNSYNESFIIRKNSFEMYKYQRSDCVVKDCSECTWVIP